MQTNLLQVELPQAELQRLSKLIDAMGRAKGVETDKVIRNVGRDLSRAALKETKLGRKTKTSKIKGGAGVIRYQEYRKRYKQQKKNDGSPAGVYWISPKNAPDIVYPGTKNEAETRSRYGATKPIRNRGFMKAGWVAALYQLGAMGKAGADSKYAKTAKWGLVGKSKKDGQTYLKISNIVPFIAEFDAGKNRWHIRQNILEKAIIKVNANMEQTLKKLGVDIDKLTK